MPCIPVSIPTFSIADYLSAHCLLAIFDHLPISDVFNLDKVCARFRYLKSYALERRREFSLVVGSEWRGFISEFSTELDHDGTRWFGPDIDTRAASRLRYETLTKEVCNYLARSLPNVSRLQVMQTAVSSRTVPHVIYLVGKWAPQLTSLKMGARYRESRKLPPEAAEEFIARNLAILVTFINQLPELQHLSLQLHHRLLPASKLLTIKSVDLPALSRLETAYLLTHDRAEVFYDSIKRYAERNADLVSLGLQCCIDAEKFYRNKLARLSPPFLAKFCAIDLGRAKLTQTDMDTVGSHFPKLTSLGFALTTPISLLPIWLRSCKRLTHLHLYFDAAHDSTSATNRSTSRSRIASVASRTSSNSSAGPQLPQIIALTLTLIYAPTRGSHLDVPSLRLEQTFPQLRLLEYSAPATSCTICGLRVNAAPELRKRCHGIALGLLQAAMPKCKVTYYLDL